MSRDGGQRNRRRFMAETLGALGGAAGLAGCSALRGGDSEDGSDSTPEQTPEDYEDTPEETPGDDTPAPEDVEHTSLTSWPQEYLLPASENNGVMIFDAWSPSQFQDSVGDIPHDQSYVLLDDNPAYSKVGFSAGEVPETFVQRKEATPGIEPSNNFSSTVKFDQLPGGVSKSDVAGSLEENRYDKVAEVGQFDVYSGEAAETVHAITEDRHAVALNMFLQADTITSQHRNYLEEVLGAVDHNNLDEDLVKLQDSMELADTYAVVNNAGYRIADNTLEGKMVDAVAESGQPSYGATTVDLDEGLKYGGWVFETPEDASEARSDLIDNSVRNGWENISTDGRVLKAAGQMDMEGRLPRDYMADTLTSLPKI